MKKSIFITFLLLITLAGRLDAQDNMSKLKITISELRGSLVKEEMKLSHLILEKYIEIFEAENLVTPTGAITVALAKKYPRIDSLRNVFEQLSEEIQQFYRQDTAYRIAEKNLSKNTPEASNTFSEVRKRVRTAMLYNYEYCQLRKRFDHSLFISNLEALKLHLQIHKDQNKYVDFQVGDVYLKRIMQHPEVKKVTSEIKLLETIIKIKESDLIKMY